MKSVRPEGFPTEWAAAPLWSMYRRTSRSHAGNEPHLSVYRELGVVAREGRTDNWNRVSEDTSSYQLVLPGDLVVNKMKAWQGSMGVSTIRGVVSPAYFVYEPLHQMNHGFMHYLLRSRPFIDAYGRMSKGIRVGQWDLDAWAFSRVPIPLPLHEEQNLISQLLDRKLPKIDALIEKQRALVNGLRARREAVIRQTITGRPVGDERGWVASGKSWTGRHPEGWRTEKVAWLFGLIGSGTTPPAEDISEMCADLIPWVNTSELRESRISEVVRGVAPEVVRGNSALKIYPAGTILFAMYGATIGRTGILDVPASVNQACLAMAKSRSDVHEKFVYYALQAAKNYIIQLASGGGQPNVNQEKVKSIGIPISNYDEQLEMVNYIDREIARIDALIAKSERMIEVAKERRSALITAAVTGQIDVREMEPGEEAA